MPTASPSIVARVPVELLTSVNPLAIATPIIPMATPTRAVTRGSPAASSDPKVITSTRAATAMPIASAGLWPTFSCAASPP